MDIKKLKKRLPHLKNVKDTELQFWVIQQLFNNNILSQEKIIDILRGKKDPLKILGSAKAQNCYSLTNRIMQDTQQEDVYDMQTLVLLIRFNKTEEAANRLIDHLCSLNYTFLDKDKMIEKKQEVFYDIFTCNLLFDSLYNVGHVYAYQKFIEQVSFNKNHKQMLLNAVITSKNWKIVQSSYNDLSRFLENSIKENILEKTHEEIDDVLGYYWAIYNKCNEPFIKARAFKAFAMILIKRQRHPLEEDQDFIRFFKPRLFSDFTGITNEIMWAPVLKEQARRRKKEEKQKNK